jgi:hypothetical protein
MAVHGGGGSKNGASGNDSDKRSRCPAVWSESSVRSVWSSGR